MTRDAIRRVCNHPRRWLIVTAVTFVLALASVLPQVDLLLAERSEIAELREQLAQALGTAERLPTYESRAAEKTEQLEKLRRHEVTDEQLSEFRSWLVGAARDSGCRVRRIAFAEPVIRPWTLDDSPIQPGKEPGKRAAKTPFVLETRSVVFSVTGAAEEVLGLLKTIDDDARLKHVHSVDVRPTNRSSRELQVELTLWYFALEKPEKVA